MVYNEGEITFLYAEVDDEISPVVSFSISIIGLAILVVVIASVKKKA